METDHISVCICTFKRPELLSRLLDGLKDQHTEGMFSYSVVVADNDCTESARNVVSNFAATSPFPVRYCVEPRQNIAMARNKALENAEGSYIAFIDDDEFPRRDWLVLLFKTCNLNGVAGVLGPVKPLFQHDPPKWVLEGNFFDRPSHRTGYRMKWTETRTGNTLFRRRILDGSPEAFRPEFDAAGEDMDFFRRMIDKGHLFVWCDEAAVYEDVPPWRCEKRSLLKRALLRGSNFYKHPSGRMQSLARSTLAVPVYTLALPVLLALNQYLFLSYLIKLFDHVSRIASFLGWKMLPKRPA